MFSERALGGEGPTRRVLRLGARVTLGDLPSLPPRLRGAMGGPSGTLSGARLRARTGEVWCRLSVRGRLPWSRRARMLALNATQPPAPTPDAVELRRNMYVDCEGGRVGRLEGLVIDGHTGLATDLLVHVRGDVDADLTGPTDPRAPLVRVQGQRVLVPPAWASKVDLVPAGLPFLPGQLRLMLNATAAQVAHGFVLRDDAALTADVWSMLAANPALAPSLAHLRVVVHDGTVILLGSLPSVRHRLSAEQDIWHVPGVLGIQDETLVSSS